MIVVEFASWDCYTLSVYNIQSKRWESQTCNTRRDDMFIAEDMEFLRAIAEDQVISCDIGESLKSLKVISTAQQLQQECLGN